MFCLAAASYSLAWPTLRGPLRYPSASRSAPVLAASSGPELSRLVVLSERRSSLEVEASADECAQLAERFGWAKLSWLRATATLTRFDAARRRTRVSGKMWGQLARTGADGGRRVLTVEAEPFESVYVPAGAGDGADAAIDLEADFDDEMGSGGEIDVGECVAQHFYLHVEDGALEELAEWVGSGLEADGTVVYDSTG
ncbi:hypothetical protein EMIHUDRAFT_462635 [Emiliania huxleyi CCMP1516]|uniref:Uncharacterized protein n=2 Tax=Emiliania huxleyi TaxID=2903 RepID=A0A0D3KBS0_EMIH1|nr:hypothetical protein EMIHUDRAFT_462635 [Emiliania huxleyi CCMP1516]EOD33205.1 hypothetical protein EMIHUDRAFT_462635 [Emiliania huxleyi CCMP1516]|eukprot:XP_005785634.1 hypothetical protein EMIHUDRAFT_462635 [Emiliania huxleyi CCMP1516]